MSKSMNRENIAKVTETKRVSPLLQGAIDMHYHGYPEITLGVKARLEDVEMLKMARSMGMRGIVIKSQMWPSTGRVYHLRRLVPGIECFSSIVLNSVVGGLSPWVVEAAARQGAKVVWLPTWSSSYKLGKGGFATMMKTWFPSLQFEPGLTCVNASGKVTPDVQSIVRLAKEMDLVLCTGHISPEESLAVAKEAERIDFLNLIFTHPLSSGVSATLEQAKEMTKRGAFVELVAINIFYGSVLDKMLDFISELGPEHCILSTDTFMEWPPPGPEFLRMFVGRLLVSGVDESSLKIMVRDNPAKLLGLPAKFEQHWDHD
ncbi:MAG: DUF6282 family protein [Desulfobacterales bacterium]|nr:DUF6282 family protein [Desulfobacterales bacterium]